jgi:YHS domain-containing protein
MKKVLFLTLVLTLGVLCNAFAAEAAAGSPTTQVNNKICPVSNEEVGSGGMAPHPVTHKGKTYQLCCMGCEKDFNKDPDKYIKMIEEQETAKGK